MGEKSQIQPMRNQQQFDPSDFGMFTSHRIQGRQADSQTDLLVLSDTFYATVSAVGWRTVLSILRSLTCISPTLIRGETVAWRCVKTMAQAIYRQKVSAHQFLSGQEQSSHRLHLLSDGDVISQYNTGFCKSFLQEWHHVNTGCEHVNLECRSKKQKTYSCNHITSS